MKDRPGIDPRRRLGDASVWALRWASFVDVVTEATIGACRDLRQHRWNGGWGDEDHISVVLADYLEERLPLFVVINQAVEINEQVRSGVIRQIAARRADIAVCFAGLPHRAGYYFTWEAKLIRPIPSSRRAYVTEGMRRHLDGAYSGVVDDGGMLGYVVDTTAAVAAQGLTAAIQAEALLPLAESPNWDASDPCLVLARSVHSREAIGRPITLHHFLVQLTATVSA